MFGHFGTWEAVWASNARGEGASGHETDPLGRRDSIR